MEISPGIWDGRTLRLETFVNEREEVGFLDVAEDSYT